MPADSNRPLFILLGAEITAMAVVISVVSFVKFSSPYFWPLLLTGGVILVVGTLVSFFLIGKTNAPGAEELREYPIDQNVIDAAVKAALRLERARRL